MRSTRRDFITKASLTGSALLSLNQSKNENLKGKFLHHVFFWLKNPGTEADRVRLLAGLKKLTGIRTIKMFQIGEPAPTNREVIDRSYSISWLLVFENQSDQDLYQSDPIHLEFIKECASLWSRVVVYDSVEVVK